VFRHASTLLEFGHLNTGSFDGFLALASVSCAELQNPIIRSKSMLHHDFCRRRVALSLLVLTGLSDCPAERRGRPHDDLHSTGFQCAGFCAEI
jgi:hypothetical protein